jgi:nucleotide-binding universal stress UspA family protein
MEARPEANMSEYKVLIPLDGSRLAEHSLAFLPALRQRGDLAVSLLSVVDFPEDLLGFVQTEEQEREQNMLSTYLREIADDLNSHLGVMVDYEVGRGPAARVILEHAQDKSPDLLVISTHGRSGVARWQRGAVADKVIREAACPVLVVGPRAMEKGQWLDPELVPPFKQILVPLDGSELAELALTKAIDYAELYDSRLHLLRVMPYLPISSGYWDQPATIAKDILEGGVVYLDGLRARTRGRDVLTAARIGSPASEIDRYIKTNDIDLVVMTSHGRGGLSRAVLGSVSDRIIGSGPPVLLVRSLE